MPTFKELVRAAHTARNDKTSGKRLREIESILRKNQIYSGVTPEKAKAVLEDLGPTFVKVGQIASNRGDVIPKEYADAFKELRTNAALVPFDEIVKAIDESLGHSWQEAFAYIEHEPLGSASIAQVHRACLLGDEDAQVAIKVRRPHVVTQMAEDIALLRHALALANLSTVSGELVLTAEELVDELERTADEELDFRVESANLQRFNEWLQWVPGVTSPVPYPELSSETVLVMEYVEGPFISDAEALEEMGLCPAELGRRLADNYVAQIVDEGFFHADPHDGNLIVRDGDIVWIDLGMTGSLSSSERLLLNRLFLAVAMNDPYAVKESLLSLSKATGPIDHGKLLDQIGNIMTSYVSADLSELDVGLALMDVIEILRTQNLLLPPSLTMLARGMMTLEGVLKTIAPTLSVASVITAHVKRQLFDFDSVRSKAKTFALDSAASAEAASRLPSQLSHSLDMVNRGQIRVATELQAPTSLIATLYSIAGTISLSMISAGLFVGSSLLAQTDMEPKMLGVPVLGVLGYVGAFFLSAYVAWRTLLVRHRQRNNIDID